jgi:hypothetical protein
MLVQFCSPIFLEEPGAEVLGLVSVLVFVALMFCCCNGHIIGDIRIHVRFFQVHIISYGWNWICGRFKEGSDVVGMIALISQEGEEPCFSC